MPYRFHFHLARVQLSCPSAESLISRLSHLTQLPYRKGAFTHEMQLHRRERVATHEESCLTRSGLLHVHMADSYVYTVRRLLDVTAGLERVAGRRAELPPHSGLYNSHTEYFVPNYTLCNTKLVLLGVSGMCTHM